MPALNDMAEYEKYYRDAMVSTSNGLPPPRVIDGYQSNDDRYRQRYRNANTLASRSRSANDDYRNDEFISDFDTDDSKRRDKEALAKHRQKYLNVPRSTSAVIYNRRDQTHPDAYIIYVFLNGQGMECQHMHFQKKQLAKGMNYVLELTARRFNVNPMNTNRERVEERSDQRDRLLQRRERRERAKL
ncbi:hypothetical protein TELCIR_04967 [Teladorsagia circumcincta]|uniref:Uncharacterized protein n=1 Tax=Teladorsagia circumcincta TaxID=45464 RepID=A0A2G9US36_TELCI|nr:hypothetical protein TELCIR_04967 [Teladorsagia circumcincta]